MLKWCSLKSNNIQVSIQVYFQTEYDSGTLGEIKDIVAAEKQIRELWETFERYNQQREVEPGSLRCTLMLEPMLAEFDEMKISSAMVDAIDRAIANNVLFLDSPSISTVGTLIEFLILQGRRELVGDDLFLESCPNLLELRLRGSVVEVRIDIRDYRASHDDVELPVVSCNWQDVSTLSQE
ncbi:hypothetical protein PC112_g11533 [Phytophthora cactorum]|nr:hypothetical protein PC112_g11533 [Phytophthora cactorum]